MGGHELEAGLYYVEMSASHRAATRNPWIVRDRVGGTHVHIHTLSLTHTHCRTWLESREVEVVNGG